VWAPLLGLVVAALLLFPLIGTYGLWDPQEITIADQARDALRDGALFDLLRSRPPLTEWLIAWSVDLLGASELAARLPLALLGFLGVAATYFLGQRLRRPRVGAFAAIILASSPLYLFQARQLIGDIGLPAGYAIAALGLTGLVWPSTRPAALELVRDLLLALAGMAIATLSGGVVWGTLLPLATTALASFALRKHRDDTAPPADYRAFLTVTMALATLAVLAAVLESLLTFVPAQPGQLALFGHTLRMDHDYVVLLGGSVIKGVPDQEKTFADTVQQVAFGMFPWTALAPLAVFALLGRRDFGSTFLFIGVTLAFLGGAIWVQKLSIPVLFPALPLIAVAVAGWIDDHVSRRLDAGSTDGMPIAALFVFLAAAILALDLRNFPVRLAAVHLQGTEMAFPTGLQVLRAAPILFGLAFGGLFAVALIVQTPQQRPVARFGLLGGLAAGAAMGVFLSFFYMPGLARHLSYKNVFEAYFAHRQGDEPLAVVGIPGKGPEFYAQGPLKQLREVSEVVKFLGPAPDKGPLTDEDKDTRRGFVILGSDKLCQLHELAVSTGLRYVVLDDSSSRYLLVSSRTVGDEVDKNPLKDVFHAEPPASFPYPVTANFDDSLELLGVDMPKVVAKGSRFKVTLWLRVKKRPTENHKVFLHFDQGSVRFLGDHPPARCGMTSWQPGDIVADTYELTAAPEITHPKGDYQLWAGFFKGSSGVWYNMPVKSEPRDPKDRVPIGTIRVE
jgi:4-amino-4-deoxy-L-arabinose transferase-like glycosyltransferase